MSLQWELSREIPADTAQIGQKVLSEENIYRQIGDRFQEILPEEDVFEELYERTGRGAISPLLLALVTVFQMMEKVPDRVAAAWVASRIDWKYALHLPLGYAGFHFTDLLAFRKRLLAHNQERLVFEQVLLKLNGQGLIKKRGKMRTDATHILGVVERLSQFELVMESLRVALKAVLEAAEDWAKQVLPGAFCEVYSQQQSEYGLSENQMRRQLLQAGQDGFWFLRQIDKSAPDGVRQLPEVEVLRKVLQQQFPEGPGGPPAKQRPTGNQVIESPHEPEVRYGTKRDNEWLGYKVQVTETCGHDQPHLIVDLEPTGALDNDSPELPKIQARLETQQTLPSEQYVDQAYMSGYHLADSAELGILLMGIPLNDTRGPEGFRQADFHIDEAAQQVTCPAEHTNSLWSEKHNPDRQETKVIVRFNAKTCQQCHFFGQCTSSPRGRSLTLHPHREILAARRAEALTNDFLDKLHLRAGIEATISELVRGYDFRSARYRGLSKLRLQAYFTAVAVNLKRLERWWSQPQPARQTTG